MVQVGALQGIDSSALSAANSRLQLLQNIAIQEQQNKRQREKNVFDLAQSAVYPGAILLRDSLERKAKGKQARQEAALTSERNAGILDIYGIAEGLTPVDERGTGMASEPVQNPDGTFSLNVKTEPLSIEQAIFQKAYELNKRGLLNKEYLDQIVSIGRYDTKSKNDLLTYMEKKANYDVLEGSPNSGANTRRVKEADLKLTGSDLDNQYKESQIAKNKADAEAGASTNLGLDRFKGLEISEKVAGDRQSFDKLRDKDKSEKITGLFEKEQAAREVLTVFNEMDAILKRNPGVDFRLLGTSRTLASLGLIDNPDAIRYITLKNQAQAMGQAAAVAEQGRMASDADVKVKQKTFAKAFDDPKVFEDFKNQFSNTALKKILDDAVLTGQSQTFNQFLPLYEKAVNKKYSYGAFESFGGKSSKATSSPTVSGKTSPVISRKVTKSLKDLAAEYDQ